MHSNLIDVPKSQRVEQIDLETFYFLLHKTTFANFFEHDFFVFTFTFQNITTLVKFEI